MNDGVLFVVFFRMICFLGTSLNVLVTSNVASLHVVPLRITADYVIDGGSET